MKLPWQRRSRLERLLHAHAEWLADTVVLIYRFDPIAGKRVSANVKDRMRLAGRDPAPFVVVQDVTRLVVEEVEYVVTQLVLR